MSTTVLPQVELYFVHVKVPMAGRGGFNLKDTIQNISSHIKSSQDGTKYLYSFKVVGEPLVVAVYDVTHFVGLEKILQGLAGVGYLDVQCDPVVPYESCAKQLGVDEELTKPSARDMKLDRCLWICSNIEYHGMTLDELIANWKPEAEMVLGARKEGMVQMELFKMAGQRKLHAFPGASADNLDQSLFTLPIIKAMGNNVNIVTKALVSIDIYLEEMAK